MLVKDLHVGDVIPAGEVLFVNPSQVPDRLIVVVKDSETGEQRKLFLFKDAPVDEHELYVDRKAIVEEVYDKLSKRLEYGRKEHGEYWKGNDPLANVEEELLDALVYIWILRRTK